MDLFQVCKAFSLPLIAAVPALAAAILVVSGLSENTQKKKKSFILTQSVGMDQ